MFDCGCDPSLEGGYGDDGMSSRYSMEWCDLHKGAAVMARFIETLAWAPYGPDGATAEEMLERWQAAARTELASLGLGFLPAETSQRETRRGPIPHGGT